MAALFAVALLAPQAARAQPEHLFTFSPEAPFTNEPVTFAVTVTGVQSQRWGLDGSGRACDGPTDPVVSRSFAYPGVYRIVLCVSDGASSWTETRAITVQNRPPVASFTYAPRAPMTGEMVELFSLSADAEGPITSQAWDLDADGAFDDASGPMAQWSFGDAGTHQARLLVADQNGATSVAALDIPVMERPPEAISPFPLVRVTAAVSNRGTRIRELVVRAPAGARVRVRCRGRRCPFRSFARKAGAEVRAARIVRIRRLRRYLLRPGTVIEIRVTKRGQVGKFTRFRIRRGRPPVRTDLCLPPGAKRPARCPRI